jgi:hypothetical protein
VAADHRVVLADDETVRIVSPTLPGHVRVASLSGRPQLDDGAKCAATHAWRNNQLMKIIPDSGYLPPRVGGASSGTRPARHDQAAHPDCLVHPVAGVVAVGPVDAGARRYVVIGLPTPGSPVATVPESGAAWPLSASWPQGRCRCAAAASGRGAAGAGRGGGDRTGRGGAPVRPVGAPLCSLTGLGVALTAIPWSRWQLAVPLLDRRPAGI